MIVGVAVLGVPLPFPWWVPRLGGWLRALFSARAPAEAAEPDAVLVARARDGDHRAFAALVNRYDSRLRGLAYRLVGDRDGMDDVLQEAYVKAYRALPGFKGDASVGTWLYRIAYNACVDELRRRRDVPGVSDDGPEPASPAPGPAEVATDRQDLAAALAALPADQRAAVLLVDAYGLDYAEAAAVLSVRAGTVASRLNRARGALRRALEARA